MPSASPPPPPAGSESPRPQSPAPASAQGAARHHPVRERGMVLWPSPAGLCHSLAFPPSGKPCQCVWRKDSGQGSGPSRTCKRLHSWLAVWLATEVHVGDQITRSQSCSSVDVEEFEGILILILCVETLLFVTSVRRFPREVLGESPVIL